jgi:plastocyanin
VRLFPRRTVTALLVVAGCTLAACGETVTAPPEPSESLAAPAVAAQPSATSSPSPSPSPSPTPTATSSGPATKGGPCNACGTVAHGGTPAAVVDATDQDTFNPSTVTVTVGQIVEWKDTGIQSHTVTFQQDPSISDNLLQANQTWEIQFTKAGSFAYICVFHQSLGMIGTVVVTSG